MLLIPYKVKNPVKNFPVAAAALISVNCLIYIITSEHLVITKGAVLSLGFASGQTPVWGLLTYSFVHHDIFHLAGNMFFLWVFSGAVEDRLGIPSFLCVYLAAGIAGGLTQDMFGKFLVGQAVPVIGASASVMGILGAYWYMYPWSRVCVFYWFLLIFRGTFEIAALWVIGSYFFLDLLHGLFYGWAKVNSGVGYVAHVFGLLAGLCYCKIIRATRDTGALSEAKATLATSDFSGMNLWNLLAVVQAEPGNLEALEALMDRAIRENRKDLMEDALKAAGPKIVDKVPLLVTRYLVDLQGNMKIYSPNHIIKLAALMKKEGMPEDALKLYQRLAEEFPDRPEAEMAIWRSAQLQWNEFKNGAAAISAVAELQGRFPQSNLLSFAQSLQEEIERSRTGSEGVAY